MTIDDVSTFITSADNEALNTILSAIGTASAARRAERNAALAEFPYVISLDVPGTGHRAGNISQVSKEMCIANLDAGFHRLATAEEIATFRKVV